MSDERPLLPDQTQDDMDDADSWPQDRASDEERLTRERPPHYDR